MSTKASLTHGQDFHLYSELFDRGKVYLELKGVQFEATNDSVTVAIPLAIWEVIREHTNADFTEVDKSDEQLRREVEMAVRERAADYSSAETQSRKAMISMGGSFVYGGADEPIDTQIAKGIEHFKQLRSEQLALRSEIERIRNQD